MITFGDGAIHTLVIDDDQSMVRLIGTTLQRHFGHQLQIMVTTKPSYAWGVVMAGQVDLCITDMDMPEINGFQLLKKLKSINPLSQVVFLTAHPTEHAARSAFALGVDDFLPTPVNTEDLHGCVQFLANRIERLRKDLQTEEVTSGLNSLSIDSP